MTKKQFAELNIGDLIQHVGSSDKYIIIGNYGNHCTAVRMVDITNPVEWMVRYKAYHEPTTEQE